MACGFKYSGIISSKHERFIVEIISCEKMEALIGKDGVILVSDEYLGVSIEAANKKLQNAHERLALLLDALKEI